MQLTVTGRDMALTRPLKEYVEKRLERVQRHIPQIIGVDAILRKERKDHVVDIRLTAPKFNLAVSGRSDDNMYASIDNAVEKLERASMRRKERKIQTPRRRAGRDRKALVEQMDRASQEDPQDEELKATKFWVKPMSVEEAMLQLKTLKFSFFVFRDSDDSQVKVVYRRTDTSYGLIEPEME